MGVIQGSYKDAHWYSEPKEDKVSTTDTGLLARLLEKIARFLDWSLGEGPCDSIRMLFSTFGCSTTMREKEEVKKILCFSILRQILRKKEILPLSQLALLQNFWQKLRLSKLDGRTLQDIGW